MTKDQLVDSHVSASQCKKAVEALHKHALQAQAKRNEGQLIDTKEENIWLVLTTKRSHPEKKIKPHKIPVVHPLVDPRDTPVCLITKDPQREYKDLLESHGIKFISRVVGITKLKGKWKPFEARRMLLQENGLFLADERVVPLLPGLLGKKFFDAKKQPIPVCLTRKDLKGELERAISSTYMHQNQGTCTSIKIGRVSQTPSQLLANLTTALPAVVKATKGEWDNIQSFNIKTNSSQSLPIWQCDLGSEEGGRWNGFAHPVRAQQGVDSNDEESESDSDVVPELVDSTKATSKKRAAEDELAAVAKKARQEDGEARSKKRLTEDASVSAGKTLKPTSKRKETDEVASQPTPSSSRTKKATHPDISIGKHSPKAMEDGAASSAEKTKSKRRKGDASSEPTTPVPTSTLSPDISTPSGKKEKKSAKLVVAEDPTLAPVPDTSSPAAKKEKKAKNLKTVPDAPSSVTTPAELKQKRIATDIGKKKKLRSVGKKSVKEGILGRF